MAHHESAPSGAPTKEYSASQLQNQRLLLGEGRDLTGSERAARVWLNTRVLAVATAGDLLESHVSDLFRVPLEEKAKEARSAYSEKRDVFNGATETDILIKSFDLTNVAVGAPMNSVKDDAEKVLKTYENKAKLKTGMHWGMEFAEEWASDSVYAWLANTWLRSVTGVDKASYVSGTAETISDWANVISQVFYGDKLFPYSKRTVHNFRKEENPLGKEEPKRKFGVKLAYKSMDFVNPVNTEAALRLLEDAPVVGDGFAWLHKKTDAFLETPFMSKTMTLAAKFVTGFHIGKDIVSI